MDAESNASNPAESLAAEALSSAISRHKRKYVLGASMAGVLLVGQALLLAWFGISGLHDLPVSAAVSLLAWFCAIGWLAARSSNTAQPTPRRSPFEESRIRLSLTELMTPRAWAVRTMLCSLALPAFFYLDHQHAPPALAILLSFGLLVGFDLVTALVAPAVERMRHINAQGRNNQ